jgi:hypothetical protein
MNSQRMSALLLNGILHGTSAVPPALIPATGQEYDPPGVAINLRVVAAESPFPTFLTLTVQKSDEVWVVFSISRSGAGAVFALASKGARTAERRTAILFMRLFVRVEWKERERTGPVNLFVIVLVLLLVLD